MSAALDDIRGTCLELQTEGNGLNSRQKLLQGREGDLNISLKHIRNVGSSILGLGCEIGPTLVHATRSVEMVRGTILFRRTWDEVAYRPLNGRVFGITFGTTLNLDAPKKSMYAQQREHHHYVPGSTGILPPICVKGERLPEVSQTPPQKPEQLGSVSFVGGGNEGLGLCAGLVRGNSEAASALQDQMDLLSAPMGHEADVIFDAHGCSDPHGAENGRSVVPGLCSPLFSAPMWDGAPEMNDGTVALGLAARGCRQGFVAGIAEPVVEPFVVDDPSDRKVPPECIVDLGKEENGPEMVAVSMVEMRSDIMRLQEENRQLLAWREAVLEVREVLEDAGSAADGKDGDGEDPVARHARWASCPALEVLLPRLQQRLQLLLSELAAARTRERSLAGTGNQPMGVDQRSICPFVDVEVKVDDSVGSGSIRCNCPNIVENVMEAKRKMLSDDDVERSRVSGEDAKLMKSMRVESETLRIVVRVLQKKEQESQERITILEREVLESSLAAAKQELLVSKLRKQLSGKATATKSEEKYHQERVTPSRRPAPRPQGPSSCVNGGPTRKPARGLQEQKKYHVEVEMVDARALRVGQTRDGGIEGDYQSDSGKGSSPSKDSCCSAERGLPSWCSRDGMPHRQSSLGAEPDASAGTPLLTTQQRSARSGAPESTARGLFDGDVERAAGLRVTPGDASGVRRCPRTPTTDILRRVLYDRSSTPEAKDERGEIGGSVAKVSPGDLRRRLFTEDRADHSRTVVWIPPDDSSELVCDISVDSDITCS